MMICDFCGGGISGACFTAAKRGKIVFYSFSKIPTFNGNTDDTNLNMVHDRLRALQLARYMECEWAVQRIVHTAPQLVSPQHDLPE